MIKAAIEFHYQGKVVKKNEIIETNEAERERLLDAGLAYEEQEEDSTLTDHWADAK